MNLHDKNITFGITSSFYTFKATIIEMQKIISIGGKICPIMSNGAYSTDTKFGKAKDFIDNIEKITNRKIIINEGEAEENIGDIMVICPCSRE